MKMEFNYQHTHVTKINPSLVYFYEETKKDYGQLSLLLASWALCCGYCVYGCVILYNLRQK